MNKFQRRIAVPPIVALSIALYVASFGPACWAYSRQRDSNAMWEATRVLYSPILRAWFDSDDKAAEAISWYANLGTPEGVTVIVAKDNFTGDCSIGFSLR